MKGTRNLSTFARILFAVFFLAAPPWVSGEPAASEIEAMSNRLADDASGNSEAFERSYRTLLHVLANQDPATSLIPDYFYPKPRKKKRRANRRQYRPENSAADNYGYLVIASYLLDQTLYRGQMLKMLRNEVMFTTDGVSPIPSNLDLKTSKKSRPTLFGAAEYAKDGLISVSELIGDSPWFWRMTEMVAATMEAGRVETKFGTLPSTGSELNGDLLQVLPRLYWRTGDTRFRTWATMLADAYLFEVLPRNNWLPVQNWDFSKEKGSSKSRLRDHGNETVVGLVLVYAMEKLENSAKAKEYEPAIRQMLDTVLSTATDDGMIYTAIDVKTLEPASKTIVDNWGYLYGAVYNFYLLTGDEKYRTAVTRVLAALPKYKAFKWERTHFDGYADSIESAIYLISRLGDSAAEAWTDSEIRIMWARQKPDGAIDSTYLQGNFIRTSLLYGLMKSKGLYFTEWRPGLGIGAEEKDGSLYVKIESKSATAEPIGIKFDSKRHKTFYGLRMNLVRLNEFPEWYTVEPTRLYEITDLSSNKTEIRLGGELQAGMELRPGLWKISPYRTTPSEVRPGERPQ